VPGDLGPLGQALSGGALPPGDAALVRAQLTGLYGAPEIGDLPPEKDPARLFSEPGTNRRDDPPGPGPPGSAAPARLR
jgi:hypothetical protein